MSEQRFACTACGLCCYGVLPLTIEEALARVDRFPLAMSLMPVKPGTKGYESLARTGVTTQLTPKNKIYLSITPVSFIPATMPCPDLAPDNKCSVHETKPVRCRAMPFYAYKDEDSQADMLVPRTGWRCVTGADAPVVYRDRKIVDPTDFNAERTALIAQRPDLQRYVDMLLQHNPSLRSQIMQASQGRVVGRVTVGLISYLRYNNDLDILGIARSQYAVMKDWLGRTQGDMKLTEFSTFYRNQLNDLERYMPKSA